MIVRAFRRAAGVQISNWVNVGRLMTRMDRRPFDEDPERSETPEETFLSVFSDT